MVKLMPRGRCASYGIEFLYRRRRAVRSPPVKEWNWTPHDPKAATLTRGTYKLSSYAAQTNYRPSRRRQKVVLVFEANVQSEGLIRALREHGLKFFYLDYLEFI